MNFSYITPNLVTGSLSVLLGLIIIYLIPTQLEQPVLIFGQSSAETVGGLVVVSTLISLLILPLILGFVLHYFA